MQSGLVKGFCAAGGSVVRGPASVCVEPPTSAELGGPLVDTALP